MTAALAGTYCGPAPLPGDIWQRWNLDPALLLALGLLALAVGRTRAGTLAVAVLVVAFVSPLCALSAALFSARVVHHVLLVAVAAPLLALAWPGRKPGSPAVPLLIATVVLWAWHWPPAYDLALSNMAAYWIMQATLLGAAFAFWRAVLHPGQAPGAGLLGILGGYMQMALLGALLTFAPQALYAIHMVAPLDWGLTPLGDQQLGGLIMWVLAGIPFVAWGAFVARRGWQAIEQGLA
ncbi:cytochrome c oxidase assembly protein [Microvirga lotononidis]|uniref:Putative membrane protein n=1 Tax=Microvirga lotononidis TaxID=864069 RepID=I4YS33_9HYPH|nr:cytochrome c oxidase assembly protein [Microvirga lotononidis]EIM26775.1 putative membrane protein [Microvirga lotononidis]WQO31681.1 cytochrome c oxidase assembly protein [Microvirga lotononidis]